MRLQAFVKATVTIWDISNRFWIRSEVFDQLSYWHHGDAFYIVAYHHVIITALLSIIMCS
jgi:hypothetical protein